ncbi:hypothetical protein K461DRAFT_291661 [Myriangium duriaei CBS 260.36]|uniref:Trafficking protein particle complex subunit 11 domain-containing protein n=1 Tax=Myriangium duriaei CBS 260.36 TaxID=1168546 RepID=A0A9P4J7A2_9PEZI|nr:hypothetical protein K461DRAFT_291661 [Myriangium duriaei CBS 260.36]
MDKSSSSKVTVEYVDPSGVFPLLKPELETRLPLRNLNWKSSTRPLRNIDALHVEFVQDASAKSETPTASAGLKRTSSTRSTRNASGENWPRPDHGHRSVSNPVGIEIPQRERRHQIPGLRQTAYLKLFILRCDDKETYKAEHRQRLRDWVRAISPQTKSTSGLSNHNNHDAFEWMIIHVVIPGTKAASEPRWTAAKQDPDELAERSKSKAKWATKGTTTVFDKLRSDFPPATKSGLEKVAQIRLPREIVPPPFLPTAAVPSDFVESKQEQLNAWHDLVAKFKTLILQSFDRRVSQYEDDIREKEAQRTLPGWNFCTFFTLKENLARGFESVGLVEDALAIYDELEAGLAVSTNNNTAFLGDMTALRSQLMTLSSANDDTGGDTDQQHRISDLLPFPFDISRHDFRSLIVSSTISLFDFHTYIFARQRVLIYRLGFFEPLETSNSDEVTSKPTGIRPRSDEQLIHIAEVCQRAASYISSNIRALKQELKSTASDQARYDTIVQRVAASWAFTMTAKMLAETAIPLDLDTAPSTTTQITNFNFAQGANPYPARRSSLMALSNLATPAGGAIVYENEKFKLSNVDESAKPALPGSGLSELAASRGELSLLQRRLLETLAAMNGWQAGWEAIGNIASTISNGTDQMPSTEESPEYINNLLDEDILKSLGSFDAFLSKYEGLTSVAIKYLILGNRLSLAENLFGDLALLKHQAGDFTGAAQILTKLVPKYTTNRWSSIETKVLVVYCDCLRKLNRRDEYVRMCLCLLRKQASLASVLPYEVGSGEMPVQNDKVTLQDLLDFSIDGPTLFRAPLEDMFADFHVNDAMIHHENEDGFGVEVQFRCQISEQTKIDSIKLKLISSTEPPQEIWLENESSIYIHPGTMSVMLKTRTTTWGLYSVRQVTFEMAKLHFSHAFEPKQKLMSFDFAESANTANRLDPTGPLIMIYPRSTSLNLRISTVPDVHVDKQRSLHVHLDVGSVDFEALTLRLKPATAGLRLHSTNATVVKPQTAKLDASGSHGIQLDPKASSEWTIKVPYSLELPQLDLAVKTEVVATKEGKEYLFLYEEGIPVDLQLDVDVNDTFKPENLFSQFSIRTTNEDPLIIHTVDVSGSEIYSVTPLGVPFGLTVFERQPVSLACMISRSLSDASVTSDRKNNALELKVDYYPLSSVVISNIVDLFDKSIIESSIRYLRRFLLPILRRLLTERLKSRALEEAVLLSELEVPPWDSLDWMTYVSALPLAARDETKRWLQSWHKSHAVLPIHLDALPEPEKRSVIVPVDVPTIDVLATASITIGTTATASASLPPVVYVGQAIQAILQISITHHWSAEPATKDKRTRLTFTVQDSTDWLLAGPSTTTFDCTPDQPSTFSLLLIPLVPGAVLLPHVEVQLAASADATPAAPTTRGRYACETDYESAAETVLVLRPPGDADYAIYDPVATPNLGGPAVGLGVRLEERLSEESERRRAEDEGKWWLQEY